MSNWNTGSGGGSGSVGPQGIPGVAGPGTHSILIYQPGGVQQNNVYSSWSDLLTVFDANPGIIEIIVDDTIVTPAVLDTSHDFEQRAIISGLNNNTQITSSAGVTLLGVSEIRNCFITANTTTSVFLDGSPAYYGGYLLIVFSQNAALAASSSNFPVIKITSNTDYGAFVMQNNSSFMGANPVLDINGLNAIVYSSFGGFGPNTIKGNGILYAYTNNFSNIGIQSTFTGTIEAASPNIYSTYFKNYFKGDTVTYNNHPYQAIQQVAGQLPTNTSYWKPVQGNTLVFQPGGTDYDNVYTSWSALLTAFDSTQGFVTIYIDDTFVSPAVLDTSHDFHQRAGICGFSDIYKTAVSYLGPDILTSAGVQLSGVQYIKNCRFVANTSTSVCLLPTSDVRGNGHLFLILENSYLVSTSTNFPVIKVTGTYDGDYIFLKKYSFLNVPSFTNTVVDVNGKILYIFSEGYNGIYPGAISGTGTIYLQNDTEFNYRTPQTNFTGTLNTYSNGIWGSFFASYDPGQEVTYNNHPYQAIQKSYNVAPTNTAYWKPTQGNTLVFQPGGSNYGNVYNTWTDVLTAFDNTPGVVTIILDGSLNGNTVNLDTGHEFQNRVMFKVGKWYLGVTVSLLYPEITTSPGVKLQGVMEISGGLWKCDTTTSECFGSTLNGTGYAILTLRDFCQIYSTSPNNAAIKATSFLQLNIFQNCSIGFTSVNNYPVINTNGLAVYIYVFSFGGIGSATAFTGTGSINLYYPGFGNIFSSSAAFTGYSGTINYTKNVTVYGGNPGNNYVNDVVSYNGIFYKCILDNLNQLPTNATYWQPIVKAGIAYSNTTAYIIGDVVTQSGNIYTCKLATTGNAPPNSTYWVQLGAIGATGATGATGLQGIQGDPGPTGAPGSAIGYSGFATLDFGNAPGTNFVTTTVTGQTNIVSGMNVYCQIMGDTTAEHNAIEHIIANIKVSASDVVTGTGFTINAFSDLRLTKTFKVRWNYS